MAPRSHRRHASGGFTLIELLVVLAIIAVLAALLIPGISLVRAMANTSKCGSNLRQIHYATLAYADDNGGALPPAYLDLPSGTDTFWFGLVAPYADAANGISGSINNVRVASSVIWGCPSFKKNPAVNWAPGYGMNFWPMEPVRVSGATRYTNFQSVPAPSNIYGVYTVFTMDSLTYPSTRPLFGDSKTWELTPGGVNTPRHRGLFMVDFCDGHVAPLTSARIVALRDDPSK
jgi:prepilin-type N-terminal cleavage/methylation domain-containing protein